MKEKDSLEVFCYESEAGEICLEFGETAINFSQKRFLEFADKLNRMSDAVLQKYLQQKMSGQKFVTSYRI